MHPTSAAALWQQAREAQENAKALAAQATAALEKEVKRARAVLKRFLLVVSKAEKRGITRNGSKKTLSAHDAKKIRCKVKMSFGHYARK